MSSRIEESGVERLLRHAETALAAGQGRRVVEPLLERLVALAPRGSDASVFAHRRLGEYRVEDHPWRALLHLRQVLPSHGEDDDVHALMGLSHALLSNFHSAIASYRRALALSAGNPWYHHNIGHLLDVALDRPAAALRHLQAAHDALSPPDAEIGASLSHCLARVGRLGDALLVARGACAAEPRNPELRRLLDWLERGAPRDAADALRVALVSGAGTRGRARTPSRPRQVRTEVHEPTPSESTGRALEPSRATSGRTGLPAESAGARGVGGVPGPRGGRRRLEGTRPESGEPPVERRPAVEGRSSAGRVRADGGEGVAGAAGEAVVVLLERVMGEGGFSSDHLARARRLWVDYRDGRGDPRGAAKPDVCAAAVEYAIARLHGLDGVSRTSVAKRYGVSARSVSVRFDDITVVLALKPGDPRYARR